jgi:hypothetical protein
MAAISIRDGSLNESAQSSGMKDSYLCCRVFLCRCELRPTKCCSGPEVGFGRQIAEAAMHHLLLIGACEGGFGGCSQDLPNKKKIGQHGIPGETAISLCNKQATRPA